MATSVALWRVAQRVFTRWGGLPRTVAQLHWTGGPVRAHRQGRVALAQLHWTGGPVCAHRQGRVALVRTCFALKQEYPRWTTAEQQRTGALMHDGDATRLDYVK